MAKRKRNFNIDESNELEQTQQDDSNSITMSFSEDDHDDDSAQSGNEGTTASTMQARSQTSRKFHGAARYRVKYNPSWAQKYPVKSVANDLFSFHCVPCKKSVRCDHQGLRDVIVHCERESHKKTP